MVTEYREAGNCFSPKHSVYGRFMVEEIVCLASHG